jgi:hypothetical protein
MKLQLKRIDLNRTVFGIYRTTAFCNQHDHWGDSRLKENIDTIQVTLSEVLKRLMQYKQQFQIQHRKLNPVRVLKSDRVILNIKDQIHLQRLRNPLLLVLNLVL